MEFDGENILAIKPRKNFSPRLNVSNIDCVNIVVADFPEPDYLLVDKMIIEANYIGASVYITVNKCYISDKTLLYIKDNYSKAVDKIFAVSAEKGEGLDKLKEEFKGKLVVFAGQSAVGKTSITNALFEKSERVNDLSKKTMRGRHTTTGRKIHIEGEFAVMDTPGFSSVITNFIKSEEIALYYREFSEYNGKCWYIGCTHTAEPDCLVKEALSRGEISADRYQRYIEIYKEIKEYEKRKY